MEKWLPYFIFAAAHRHFISSLPEGIFGLAFSTKVIVIKKWIYCCLLVLGWSLPAHAQFSSADSAFLDAVFDEQPYADDIISPGNWYTYPLFNTVPELFSSLDSIFKFQTGELGGAYSHIELQQFDYDTALNPTFNYYYNQFGNAYQQYDPIVKQRFELNNKTQEAYSTYTPGFNSSSCSVGYLIIPGSNANQTTELIQGTGYHNINCQVKHKLLQTGDVYIYCKPLEDFRALRWNGLKLNSSDYVTPGASSYIYNYLNTLHKPYAVNYMIECLALLKMMKTKYHKVVVVGCSLGGYSSLIAGLEAPVDAAIVSSGYSIKFDNAPNVMFELTQNFDTAIYQYPMATVQSVINQNTNKQFYFTYADQDNYYYQLEHDSSYTQNYLANSTNCYFFTNYSYHAFPTGIIMDSMVTSILSEPTVRFEVLNQTTTNCSTKVHLCPSGLFSFYLKQNGVILDSFINVQDSILLNLTIPGYYTLYGITQGSYHPICLDTINFNWTIVTQTNSLGRAVDISIVNPVYDQLQWICNYSDIDCRRIMVTDLTGHVVYANDHYTLPTPVNTGTWPSGMYFIHLMVDDKTYNFKVMKP